MKLTFTVKISVTDESGKEVMADELSLSGHPQTIVHSSKALLADLNSGFQIGFSNKLTRLQKEGVDVGGDFTK